MKLARVIGRVVLSKKDTALKGGFLVIASPLDKTQYKNKADTSISKTQFNLIIYDNLGNFYCSCKKTAGDFLLFLGVFWHMIESE